jgi:hypothetical protein
MKSAFLVPAALIIAVLFVIGPMTSGPAKVSLMRSTPGFLPVGAGSAAGGHLPAVPYASCGKSAGAGPPQAGP